ncbi:Cysteine proteinases superfamily protein [Zea mays]|uniref:Cysteine proteinases superfamily protein n=1 Tax=Zea mays TaxID=4577 RepID=A0A1D6JXE0_MAIZE|nr:Cysteine proteinases superfamily protein [Zea mays]
MAAAARPSNATLLARLRDGTAKFELLDDSAFALAHAPPAWPRLHCFARIAPSLYVCVISPSTLSAYLNRLEEWRGSRVKLQNLVCSNLLVGRRGGWSAALNKVEHYGVQRVTGDGRCMFRALVSCSIISYCAFGWIVQYSFRYLF